MSNLRLWQATIKIDKKILNYTSYRKWNGDFLEMMLSRSKWYQHADSDCLDELVLLLSEEIEEMTDLTQECVEEQASQLIPVSYQSSSR